MGHWDAVFVTRSAMARPTAWSWLRGKATALWDGAVAPCSRQAPVYEPLGVCLYLASFALPWPWDLSLLGLALTGVLAIVGDVRHLSPARVRLDLPVLLFVVATGLSTLFSADMGRSVQLSAPFVPAVLLYFTVTEHFDGPRYVRHLYLTCSTVGLGLASLILWAVWQQGGGPLGTMMVQVGSPVLVEDNDSALLTVIAPFSLVLLCHETRRVIRLMAVLSLLVSVCVVCLLVSRTATLTMIVCLTCTVVLMQPRRWLAWGAACGLGLLRVVLLIDGVQGFPLLVKCLREWQGRSGLLRHFASGRMPLWLAAWAMFLDAPLLGHGPHTFVFLYPTYLHDLHIPFRSSLVAWPHNLYLEVLAERGLVGLMALGFLSVRGVVTAWYLQRAAPPETRRFSIGALAGLIGLCGAVVVELTFLRLWVVIMMFTLLGVITLLSASQFQIRRVD